MAGSLFRRPTQRISHWWAPSSKRSWDLLDKLSTSPSRRGQERGKCALFPPVMSSLPSSSFAPGEAPSWERAWRDIQPTLSSLRSTIASWPKPQPRIMRVGQLDAELLDQELATTLKEPVNKALGQLGVSSSPTLNGRPRCSLWTFASSQYTKRATILK